MLKIYQLFCIGVDIYKTHGNKFHYNKWTKNGCIYTEKTTQTTD